MDGANQNNGEVSMATAAAAAEVPGKGSVDGKVQEVTESSGPGQPKSLDGLPSAYNSQDFRQRPVSKGKSKLEQGASLDSSTEGYVSPKKAAENAGVQQGGPGGDDAVHPVNCWGKIFEYAKLGSQKEPVKDGMEDVAVQNKEDDNVPMLQLHSRDHHTSSQSAGDNGGTMEMEPGGNIHSNPSQENAESSCKSRTAEWALLVTSVVLEATSASCDQLGYALTSMVMAFLALFLSILDLIFKARQRGITCDGRGLLPCFYRHDVRNRKPFASLVQYFGLAGAVWQCSFTTVGYHYTHHKLVNPIKLCLLPFILALCVLISKVVKSSQHES